MAPTARSHNPTLLNVFQRRRELVDSGGYPQLKDMKDKLFLGALQAEFVCSLDSHRKKLLDRAAANEIQLWLPRGACMGGNGIYTHKPFNGGSTAKQSVAIKLPKAAPRRKRLVPSSCSMKVPFSGGVVRACV